MEKNQASFLSSISSTTEDAADMIDMSKISKGILPNVCDPCLLKFQLGQMKIKQTYDSAMMQIKQQFDLAMMKLFIELCACRAQKKLCCNNVCQKPSMFDCSTNDQAQKAATDKKESSRAWESSRY